MDPKDYCTTGEVALRAGVSPAAVRLWERNGRLKPAARLTNGTRLFDRADVDRLIATRTEKPLAPVDEA